MRKVIFDNYYKIVKEGKYAALQLKNNDQLTSQMINIIYGTLKNKILLEFYIKMAIGKNKLKGKTKIILELAFFEILYTNNQKYAISNEYTKIAKTINQFEGNKVNAILRNFNEEKANEYLLSIKNLKKRRATKYSIPMELYEYCLKTNGKAGIELLKKMQMQKHINFARINRTLVEKINTQTIDEHQISYPILNETNFIQYKGDLSKSSQFKNGLFYIQNISSFLAYENKLFKTTKKTKILDMCAAPGGKTTHIMEQSNFNEMYANDIHKHKLKLITENVKRLKLKNIINLTNVNALELTNVYPQNNFDIVVLDVPCSGLGVISHKPEIKYNFKVVEVEKLIKLQAKLLKTAYKLVKQGGYIFYSTCTFNQLENNEIVKNYEIIEEQLIDQGDAFYYAVIKKN